MFQRRKEQPNVEQQNVKSSPSHKPTSPPRIPDKQPRGVSRRHVERERSPPRNNKSTALRRTERAISPTELTWSEAHRRTCLERKSLAVSFDQVTEAFSNFRQFPRRRDEFVLWTKGSNLETAAAVNRQVNGTSKPTTMPSKLESKPERPSSWAKRLLSTMSVGVGDDGLADLGDDDGEEQGGNFDDVVVEPDEIIVNVELAQACLQEMRLALRDQATPRVFLRNSSESNIQSGVAKRFSFETWCQQVATRCKNQDAQVILANADPNMSDFLGAMLVANNLATFAPNREDRIVLGSTSALPPAEVGTMVTLFDLQINEESMKKKVEHWCARADDCGRSALEARRKGRTRQAAMDLQRRKTILQQVENTRNSLLQIEQIRHTLEHAQSQTEAIECLQSTADALKNMRTQPADLQALHSDIDNNRTALDQNAIHHTFVTSSEEDEALLQGLADLADDVDEEQLLLELNELQQLSPVATKPSGPVKLVGATTGISTPQTGTGKPNALVNATIGIASTKHGTKSPTRVNGAQSPRKEEIDDPDIQELERRLEALRAPVSSNKKNSNNKTPGKTLASAAIF